MEDGPADFGLPQRLVWGIGGADEVVLANRPVDRERVPSHVVGEGAVRSVDFGAGAEVDRTYGALAAYVTKHALAVDGPIREYYLVGPSDTPDESLWQTEIGWPIFQTRLKP